MGFFPFLFSLFIHTFPCTFIFLIPLCMKILTLPSLLLTNKPHISFFPLIPLLLAFSLLSSSQSHDKAELSRQTGFGLLLFFGMELYFSRCKLPILVHWQ